eukprot:c9669_g1_i2.p1 GENE.c9669_g1_i2~~c9669_g1_i2.p1  ORF type:complete len:495 (+),score=118.39 c9669_g1_i2:66-1550(+)
MDIAQATHAEIDLESRQHAIERQDEGKYAYSCGHTMRKWCTCCSPHGAPVLCTSQRANETFGSETTTTTVGITVVEQELGYSSPGRSLKKIGGATDKFVNWLERNAESVKVERTSTGAYRCTTLKLPVIGEQELDSVRPDKNRSRVLLNQVYDKVNNRLVLLGEIAAPPPAQVNGDLLSFHIKANRVYAGEKTFPQRAVVTNNFERDCWIVPKENPSNSFLEVDLGCNKLITAVSTKARHPRTFTAYPHGKSGPCYRMITRPFVLEAVPRYRISFRLDHSREWISLGEFEGNKKVLEEVAHDFSRHEQGFLFARYLRFHPIVPKGSQKFSMRIGVYGREARQVKKVPKFNDNTESDPSSTHEQYVTYHLYHPPTEKVNIRYHRGQINYSESGRYDRRGKLRAAELNVRDLDNFVLDETSDSEEEYDYGGDDVACDDYEDNDVSPPHVELATEAPNVSDSESADDWSRLSSMCVDSNDVLSVADSSDFELVDESA